MRYPWLSHCLVGCALFFSFFAVSAQAASYTIDTTTDVAVRVNNGKVQPATTDGKCSLREALFAINHQVAVDSCPAGTGSNTVRLAPGETYELTKGQLPVGGGGKFDDGGNATEDVDPAVSLVLDLEPFDEGENQPNAVISAGNRTRVFRVHTDATLSIKQMTIRDGQAPDGANGGLIHANGNLALRDRVHLLNGVAESGGAVFLAAGGELVFSGTVFRSNRSVGAGGVIGTAANFDGAVVGSRFLMRNNRAGSGGIVHLQGAADTRVSLNLLNGLIFFNGGGGIHITTPDHNSGLVNLTVAFNGGTALFIAEDPDAAVISDPEAEPVDRIQHSAFVGNARECGGSGLVGPNGDALTQFLFVITDSEKVDGTSGCPSPDEAVLVSAEPNNAQSDVFLGSDGEGGRQPCAVDARGSGGCDPLAADMIGGSFDGFLPNHAPSEAAKASLYDRASPSTSAENPCAPTDIRGNARSARCDVGAVEFVRAQAKPDEIELISGQSVVADVVANDLNDAQINCNLLADPNRCVSVVVAPERGTVATEIDNQGYPRLRYTPATAFHGVDSMRYSISREAIIGGTDGGQDLSELVNFVAEPKSGLTESDSIGSSGGSLGWVSLLAAIAAGMLRRGKRLLLLPLLLGSAAVQAADITVNSLEDQLPPVPNDGKCILREALQNAAGSNPSSDCAFGDKGSDTILLPAGTIAIRDTLVVEGGSVVFEGKGAREVSGDDTKTLTRIVADKNADLYPFRLIEVQSVDPNAYPTVTFQFLRLQGGSAVGTGSAGSGGAVLTGGSVFFDRVVVENNRADEAGGVVFLRSNFGNQKVLNFNRSLISGNHTNGNGGVMSSVAQEEVVDVIVSDSTFAGNDADVAGGVFDANIGKGSPFAVANSTFTNNDAPTGSVFDLRDVAIQVNLMNVSLVSNTSGNGIELGNGSAQVTLANSLYLDSGDGCTTGTTVLAQSEYNLFSSVLCAEENPPSDSSMETNDSGGSASDVVASLEGEDGTDTDYIPPHLPPSDVDPLSSLVVDKGNPEELAAGTATPVQCRSADLRGVSRTSGEQCDRGAFEYQQITAIDDDGGNNGTPDRRVLLDILANDLPSDGAEFALVDPDSSPAYVGRLSFEDDGGVYTQDSKKPHLYNGPGDRQVEIVWDRYNEERAGFAVACGEPLPQTFIDNNEGAEEGDLAENCMALYTPGKLASDARVCDPERDGPLSLNYRYSFTDSKDQTSNLATVTMDIVNKAPTMAGESKRNERGEQVVFDLEVTDPDGSAATIDWSTLSIAREPMFAREDTDGNVEGIGLLLNEPSEGQVTYIPSSNLNSFTDTFQLVVQDNCGAESLGGEFEVTYPQEDRAGGDPGGSLGALLFGFLLLLRRR